jgi:drug/metabolite transporter (DMT)-like permease
MRAWVIILVIFCSILGATGQLYMKKGADVGFSIDKIFRNWKLFLGFSLYGLAFLLYTFALRYGKLSILYSLIAFSYIWVMILSAIVLNEPVTTKKIIGSVVIVSGVWLIIG